MLLLRVVLSIVLVVLLGKYVPPLVHDVTPFTAEDHEEEKFSLKFASSRMMGFFEYQITYDFKIPVNMSWFPRRDDMFGTVDDLSYKVQFDLNWKKKVNSDSVIVTTFNATVPTATVPPIGVKANFLVNAGEELYKVSEHLNIGVRLRGAEPIVNPLRVSLIVIYVITVTLGVFIEILGLKSKSKSTNTYTPFDHVSKKGKSFLEILFSWMMVVLIVMVIVVVIAISCGIVPSIY